MIPNVILSELEVKNGKILVAREDLLPGGTKQRAAIPFIEKMMEFGHKTFNYASPFCGYAQIALAIACKHNNAQCNIAAVKENSLISYYSQIASKNNAKIYTCDNLEEAEILSTSLDGFKIPLGFNHPIYKEYFKTTLKEQFDLLNLPKKATVWLPVGSGTLIQAVRKCIPNKIIGVDVGVLPKIDSRISNLYKLENVEIISTFEPFVKKAEVIPPIPSNPHYDAKLWRFLFQKAKNNDLWWNVAT